MSPLAKERPDHESSTCECPDQGATGKRQSSTGFSAGAMALYAQSFHFFAFIKSAQI